MNCDYDNGRRESGRDEIDIKNYQPPRFISYYTPEQELKYQAMVAAQRRYGVTEGGFYATMNLSSLVADFRKSIGEID